MIELIATIIFIISFSGVLFILYRKVPVLNTLSQNGSTGIREHHYIRNIESKIKDFFLLFKKQILLHKLLFWVKRLIVKAEVKIDHLMHSIRRKAQKIDKELKEKK